MKILRLINRKEINGKYRSDVCLGYIIVMKI